MPTFRFVVAATLAAAVQAQDCTGTTAQSVLRNRDPWGATFFYGSSNGPTGAQTLALFFDLETRAPITIEAMQIPTYDQGAGNPVIPTQLGNVAEVRVYLIPGTRTGNETNQSAWGIDALGVGTADGAPEALGELTVVAWNGDSPIVNFKDPVTGLPAPFDVPVGQFGVCLEVIPTTWSGTTALPQTNLPLLNPGPLHTIGVSPNPGVAWADDLITVDNDGVQQRGWQIVDPTGVIGPNPSPTGVIDSINIEIAYTPSPNAARSLAYGEGCYDRPRAFYDQLPEATASGSYLENTGMSFAPLGAPVEAYLPGAGAAYAPPGAGATNLAAGAFTSSSSASWDDASVTQALGFTFPFPGGSTDTVTINSNGKIYLGVTLDGSFATNGASYGSVAVLENGPPSGPLAQWCPFFTDLDPSDPIAPAGSGVFFEQLTPTSCRIHWHDLPNWPAVAGQLSQVSMTLDASGQVDVAWGVLENSAPGSGNDALIGFASGNGEPVGMPQMLTGLFGTPTGNGAVAPKLVIRGRPVAGATVDLEIEDVSPGTICGCISFAYGFEPLPGVSLANFGLPGCSLFIDNSTVLAGVFFFPGPQNELRWSWSVPTGFNGVGTYLQAATLTPGVNAASLLMTNGLCARLGL